MFNHIKGRTSLIVWMVNINHLLWGMLFVTAKKLPDVCPFPGTTPFNDAENVMTWGVVLILASLLSMASDFVKHAATSTCLLVPQQLVVMYGAALFVQHLFSGDDLRVLLASSWFLPVAIFHTIALISRPTRIHQYQSAQLLDRIKR